MKRAAALRVIGHRTNHWTNAVTWAPPAHCARCLLQADLGVFPRERHGCHRGIPDGSDGTPDVADACAPLGSRRARSQGVEKSRCWHGRQRLERRGTGHARANLVDDNGERVSDDGHRDATARSAGRRPARRPGRRPGRRLDAAGLNSRMGHGVRPHRSVTEESECAPQRKEPPRAERAAGTRYVLGRSPRKEARTSSESGALRRGG